MRFNARQVREAKDQAAQTAVRRLHRRARRLGLLGFVLGVALTLGASYEMPEQVQVVGDWVKFQLRELVKERTQ